MPKTKRNVQQTPKKGKRSKPSQDPPASKKTLRRNIITLSEGFEQEDLEHLDRFMIAMHRFQTEGQLEYRRMIGMHGGGGGTSDLSFKKLLAGKVLADLKSHYADDYMAELSDFYWPAPVPNAAPPMKYPGKDPKKPVSDKNMPNPFMYTFCWHAEPEFIVWHRALTAEFERELQKFDPSTLEEEPIHSGPEALGLLYWGWEHWDGQTLPTQVSAPTYTIRTDKYQQHQYSAGDVIPNPLFRWLAPVSVEDQEAEKFADSITDANCSTRSAGFDNPAMMAFMNRNGLGWRTHSENYGHPSMSTVVNCAMQQPNFLHFGTMKDKVGGAQYSIENAHNKFHNHIGGYTMGGLQGPGQQINEDMTSDPKNPAYYTGTMAQNQSIFDPIFWLHHGNVERQLCSWQKVWFPQGTDGQPVKPESQPPDELLNKVLYPWTKPGHLAEGHVSWNTPTDPQCDATFGDWFHAELTYEYDQYIAPQVDFSADPSTAKMLAAPRPRVRLVAYIDPRARSGDLALYHQDKLVAAISVLSAFGGGCPRCHTRESAIDLEVGHLLEDPDDLGSIKGDLELRKNGQPVEVIRWEAALM